MLGGALVKLKHSLVLLIFCLRQDFARGKPRGGQMIVFEDEESYVSSDKDFKVIKLPLKRAYNYRNYI